MILRLYECRRSATRCTLTTTLAIARVLETDMLEENGEPVAAANGRISLDFRAFEVKTLRLSPA
jgi:alpha-mannosidase